MNSTIIEAASQMLKCYSEYGTTGFYFDIVDINDLDIINLAHDEFKEARDLCLKVISELENEGKVYPLIYGDLDNKLDELTIL